MIGNLKDIMLEAGRLTVVFVLSLLASTGACVKLHLGGACDPGTQESAQAKGP